MRLHFASRLSFASSNRRCLRATNNVIEALEQRRLLSVSAMLIHELGGPGSGYGHSVSMDGRLAAIGAVFDSERTDYPGPGYAYVFDTLTGKQLWNLKPTQPYSTFGGVVAISGKTVAVGRFFDGSNSPNRVVHLFDASTGKQLRTLKPSDAASINFGSSVAIDGKFVLVGSSANFDGTAGAAYLFDADSGKQLAKLKSNDRVPNNSFGSSVKIDGNIAIVGSNAAAYTFNVTSGKQIARLQPTDSAGNSFGSPVAINGNVAMVGNKLFNSVTGQQIRTLKVSGATGVELSGSVALDSRLAVVVGRTTGDESGLSRAVYVFDAATGEFLTKISRRVEPGSYGLGGSMAISDGRLLIGNSLDFDNGDAYEGAVYLYQFIESDTGSISGRVFNDLDKDGRKDSGEPGLKGRTLYIDLDNDKQQDANEPSALTSSSGKYTIKSLGAGSYNIRQVLPAGWTQSTPRNNHGFKVTLAEGQNFNSVLHGSYLNLGSISGRVFNDLDHDGRLDAGEAGLKGRTLYIDLDDDMSRDANEPAAVTNSNGWYTIKSLPAGYYNVRQILPAGWSQSTPKNGYGYKVNLLAGQNIYSALHGAFLAGATHVRR